MNIGTGAVDERRVSYPQYNTIRSECTYNAGKQKGRRNLRVFGARRKGGEVVDELQGQRDIRRLRFGYRGGAGATGIGSPHTWRPIRSEVL